jgi:hypothetical protein
VHVSRARNRYGPVTGQTYGRDGFTKVILALSLAGLGCCSAAASPRSEPSCRDAALVSVKTYKVLLRVSARNGITPLRKPLLPGLDAVADGHGGWYVAGIGLGHPRHGGRLDRSWHAALRRINANAIEVRGQTAYLGGTIRDSIPLYNLLAINLRTGERRVWFPRVAGSVQVERIAVSGEKLFVGGEFCSSFG